MMKFTIALIGILVNAGCDAVDPVDPFVHNVSIPPQSQLNSNGRPIFKPSDTYDQSSHLSYHQDHLQSSAPDSHGAMNPSSNNDPSAYLHENKNDGDLYTVVYGSAPHGTRDPSSNYGQWPHLYHDQNPHEGKTHHQGDLHSSAPHGQGAINSFSNIDPGSSSGTGIPNFGGLANSMFQPYNQPPPHELYPPQLDHYQTWYHDNSLVNRAENTMTQPFDQQPPSELIPDHKYSPQFSVNDVGTRMTQLYDRIADHPDPWTLLHHGNLNPQPEGSSYLGSLPTAQVSYNFPGLTHGREEKVIPEPLRKQFIFDRKTLNFDDFGEQEWYARPSVNAIERILASHSHLRFHPSEFRDALITSNTRAAKYFCTDKKSHERATARAVLSQNSFEYVLQNARNIWYPFFQKKSGVDVAKKITGSGVHPEIQNIFPVYLFFVEMIDEIVQRVEPNGGIISARGRMEDAVRSFFTYLNTPPAVKALQKVAKPKRGSSINVAHRRRHPLLWNFLQFWFSNHRLDLSVNESFESMKRFFNVVFLLSAARLTDRLTRNQADWKGTSLN